MAIQDAAVFKPGVAHFYTNKELGAKLPKDLRNPGEGWEHMGHTSMEDILEAASDGGDLTILGSLQKRNLRSSREALTSGFTINLLQLDEKSWQFYLGSNAVKATEDNRLLNVPSTPEPVVASWYVVMYDGQTDAGFYSTKAEFMRADDISVSDTESLLQLPVTVTPMGTEGADPYSVILPHPYNKGGSVPDVVPGG